MVVLLNWALVSSFRLSIVTVLLSAAVWSQFAVQILREEAEVRIVSKVT